MIVEANNFSNRFIECKTTRAFSSPRFRPFMIHLTTVLYRRNSPSCVHKYIVFANKETSPRPSSWPLHTAQRTLTNNAVWVCLCTPFFLHFDGGKRASRPRHDRRRDTCRWIVDLFRSCSNIDIEASASVPLVGPSLAMCDRMASICCEDTVHEVVMLLQVVTDSELLFYGWWY